MEEDVTRKFSLKTYSRTKNRDRKNDAVFSEKALESLKQNIFSPDDKISAGDSGGRKRQRSKSTLPGHGSLKQLKKDRNKKAILKVKIQRKPSEDLGSLGQDTCQDDVLFGENIQPVKTRKISNARRTLRDETNPKPGVKGRQRRNSVRKAASNVQKKIPESESKNSVEEETGFITESMLTLQEPAIGSDKKGLPPESEIRSEDKVSNWLARSDKNNSQHDDSSKEIWRGEQQLTGDEMRNKLFPDEFFQNLNHVLQKPELRPVETSKHAKDKFLSQLALKNIDLHVVSEPQTSETWNCMSLSGVDEDITLMYTDTQSGTQTGTGTETGTKTFTTGTATSRYTETQSKSHMVSSRSNDQLTESTEATHWTEELATAQTDTNSKSYTGTQIDTLSHGFQSSTKSTKTSGTGGSTSNFKEQSETAATEEDQTVSFKSARVQNYLCSTMRRGISAGNTDFPSELSSVTDSLKTQKQDEKTPRRSANEFKVPGSPTKCAAFKGARKGTLQPKNSTKLFTSGFVEIVDVIPQMSTIINEPSSKSSPEEQTGYVEKEVPPNHKQQNIKTSTPNKVDPQGQAFQFETDISSVNMDSEDDELLHFQESREVNSEECIHLSDIVIENHQDDTLVADNAEVQSAEEYGKTNSGAKEMPCITANMRRKGKLREQSSLTSDKPQRVNRKVLITSQQTRGVSKRLPRKNLGNKSAGKRLSSGTSGVSMPSVNVRCNSSGKLSGNIQTSCDIINNGEKVVIEKEKSFVNNTANERQNDSIQQAVDGMNQSTHLPSAKIGSHPKMDVYDIDVSAVNVLSPHSQWMARKQNLFTGKHKQKKSLKECNGKYKKNVNKASSKGNSSDIYFNPKGPLRFSSSSHLDNQGKDLSNLFYTRSRISSRGYGGDGVSRVEREGSVPICTLNKEFTCPKGNASIFKFKTGDTRTRQEVLDTVTIDCLMW